MIEKITMNREKWKGFLDAMKVMGADDVKLDIGSNQIGCDWVDPAHVLMMLSNIDGCKISKGLMNKSIGIKLEKLYRYFNVKGKKDELVELLIDLEESKISFTAYGVRVRRSIMPESQTQVIATPRIPELKFDCGFTLSTKDFGEFIKAADIMNPDKVHGAIEIGIEKCTPWIESPGRRDKDAREAGEFITTVGMWQDGNGFSNVKAGKDDVSTMYAMDYIKAISKALKKSEELQIRLSTNYPIEITGDVGAEIKFLFAPRIKD